MFSSNASQVSNDANYIEDVFSTWLYTGNGSTQTITNGIDLAGEGGLVWVKARSTTGNHRLFDTDRGVLKPIYSNLTNAQATEANTLTAFNANGFTLGSDSGVNQNTQTWASWSFRKQPKFFDVVTYTGNGVAGRTVAHNLGSTPGMMIVKNLSIASNWRVYHQSLGATKYMYLNTTSAAFTGTSPWNDTAPTSTVFTVGNDSDVNNSGDQFVAYLFAHNAGGFGLTGTDNVISCGSYTGDNSGNGVVTLGWEPQWLMVKRTNSTAGWYIVDNMRGFTADGVDTHIQANLGNAEGASASGVLSPIATGFKLGTSVASGFNNAGGTYIYIAIRRGPMKVPESGTSVFSPVATTASGNTKITTDFPIDFQIQGYRTASTPNNSKVMTRLTGVNTSPVNNSLPYLITALTDPEATAAYTRYWDNTGFEISSGLGGGNSVYWNFQRAPGFMDVVAYTGSGSAPQTIYHNLGVSPELMIFKQRNVTTTNWYIYHKNVGNTKALYFTTAAPTTSSVFWNNTDPTSSYVTGGSFISTASTNYVGYLFATVAGVSKVGGYTGTATTLQIDCGFTAGARFVLIKRTDSTGAWYVWDSARGIVSGNDSYLLLNSTAAEVTSTDYIDTYSAGFEISSTAPAAINASGGTFLFFAVA